MPTSRNYNDFLAEQLADPNFATEHLQECLLEAEKYQDMNIFYIAIKEIAYAQGVNMNKLSKQTNITRQHIRDIFQGNSNPSFPKLMALLSSLGLGISFFSKT